jgi:hypothetical protein
MPLALLLLALAMAANVLLGPLGLGLLQWRVSPNGLNQTYGADAASLALVVPAALAASRLWRRGHRLAAPLALGVGLATLYYAVAETLGGDYLRYEGNNERFFLLFLALIVLGWAAAARAWAELDPEPPLPPAWLGRGFGAVLLLAGGVLGLAWTAQLVPIALTGAVGPEYLDSPSAFWTIRIVDLGFIVPLALWTGVGLWRGSVTALLEPGEAQRLRDACADRQGRPDLPGLSEAGRAVLLLLSAPDPDGAQDALRRLPAALRERLTALSPTTYLPDLRAPLIVLLHDRDDPVIPVGESRGLRDALAGRGRVRYTEFTVFKHLDPTKGNPSPVALAREIVRFGRALYPLFQAAVAS